MKIMCNGVNEIDVELPGLLTTDTKPNRSSEFLLLLLSRVFLSKEATLALAMSAWNDKRIESLDWSSNCYLDRTEKLPFWRRLVGRIVDGPLFGSPLWDHEFFLGHAASVDTKIIETVLADSSDIECGLLLIVRGNVADAEHSAPLLKEWQEFAAGGRRDMVTSSECLFFYNDGSHVIWHNPKDGLESALASVVGLAKSVGFEPSVQRL
jgi:hypothetical protein